MAEKNCKLCFHYAVCYAVGRMLERAETCSKYAPDVVEVKHGRWGHECLECSVCKRNISEICDADSYLTNGIEDELLFCPFCGAKMDLSEKPTGCGRRDT